MRDRAPAAPHGYHHFKDVLRVHRVDIPHATMEQQNPSSPQCVQGYAAGADGRLRYVRPFSHTLSRHSDDRKRVRVLSRRAREALMQEEEPKCCQPRIQPLHVPITIGSTVCHTC
jgi:hypothetical protein